MPLPQDVYDLLCNWQGEPRDPWPADDRWPDDDGCEVYDACL